MKTNELRELTTEELIKKVNERVNIKKQKLNTFERNGFVAVEWGGMTYDSESSATMECT